MYDLEIQQISHGGLDLLNTRITEFYYFPTIHADQVIVLLVAIGFFILRQIFTKLMLGDEVATDQKFKCIIDRSSTHPVIGIFHVYIQRLCIEMIGTAVDLFQDSIAFRRATKIVRFEMAGKYLSDIFK